MESEFLFSIYSFCDTNPLTKKTVDHLKSVFQVKSFLKGELITSPNQTFNKIAFIRKGMVRGFVRVNTNEITNWISVENEIFTSSSFFAEDIFTEEIEALEDSTIEYIDQEDCTNLLQNTDFLELSNRLFREYYTFANRRSLIARIPKSKDRLEYFLNNYDPKIIERCPKKYLASFLNMRPETLSRLVDNDDLKVQNTHESAVDRSYS